MQAANDFVIFKKVEKANVYGKIIMSQSQLMYGVVESTGPDSRHLSVGDCIIINASDALEINDLYAVKSSYIIAKE